MASVRTKRVLFVLGFFMAVLFGTVLYFAYMLSRDVAFDWEHPNIVEATAARTKLKKYDDSLARGDRGYVRLTQLEINSYLMTLRTNFATNKIEGTAAVPIHLHKVGVNLGQTNFVLYSWGHAKVFGLSLPFVLQRGFGIQQEGTNHWEFPVEFMRVGDMDIPQEFWPRLEAIINDADAPLLAEMRWMTNIQAMLVTKNELSERPEFRLYTYKPIPIADFH
jgi:hypothetical protein